MRMTLIAAVSALALTGAATAVAAAPVAITQAVEYTDAQLQAFATAMTAVRAAGPADGATPTPEQQAAMAAAVDSSGMDIAAFNALGTAVSTDEVLQARLAVLAAPESAAGSVAASVTDEEAAQFAAAMVQVRAAGPTDGTTPTTEQQAAMAAAVTASGLELERFNAIAQAVSTDERLQARMELADAQTQ
ncbi:hypothetical protein BZG35_03020 [Brevundimonas sp. LM2]|uniref:DUF4168 domain-containing protein n=1 Tax=Brevundimonas sp. LM2 TaxID=1938605 RepID=UPI000983AE1A|nr:DUF4168 domain-containing protein [Brevundimonas sp. LM2]AQR60738.1 hypothetical protein BZG35_03020 [Brevundimonas sp. LM2]